MTFFLQLLLLCCICISWLHSSDQNSTYQNEQALRDAISEGSQFLLQNQNEDGSWGTAQQTKGLNIYAPIPGAHQAFRLAVTALSISALLDVQKDNLAFQDTITRGKEYLLENLGNLRRPLLWQYIMCGHTLTVFRHWLDCMNVLLIKKRLKKSGG